MIEKFMPNHSYQATQDWNDNTHPSLQLPRILVHQVHKGDTFLFRGVNLGQAEFIDSQGRLSSRMAFRILRYF